VKWRDKLGMSLILSLCVDIFLLFCFTIVVISCGLCFFGYFDVFADWSRYSPARGCQIS
jgi:hypothetical protein